MLNAKKLKAIRGQKVAVGHTIQPATVLIGDGVITSIESYDFDVDQEHLLDAGDLLVFPGLIDPHVHLNEPGNTNWEGFETGTSAAAAGGITTLFDMPLNSIPVTIDEHSLRQKEEAAIGKLSVDVGFHGGLVADNLQGLKEIVSCQLKTLKCFLIDSGLDEFQHISINELREAAPLLADSNITLLAHAELESGRSDVLRLLGNNATTLSEWNASRPPTMEVEAIKSLISIAEDFSLSVHIVHVAAKEALPLIKAAKERGISITAETCPHYLFFATEELPQEDARFKCAPPIRTAEDREALWAALADGTLDFIATDHSPAPPDMKMPARSFAESWGGISSLQYLLSAVWTEAEKRGFTFEQLIPLLSTNAARLVKLDRQKGKLEAGFDADVVIWNPDSYFTPDGITDFHRHDLSVFLGQPLRGKVQTTILHGDVIFHDGKFAPLKTGCVLTPSPEVVT